MGEFDILSFFAAVGEVFSLVSLKWGSVNAQSNDDSNGNETTTTNYSDLNHAFTLSAKVVLTLYKHCLHLGREILRKI